MRVSCWFSISKPMTPDLNQVLYLFQRIISNFGPTLRSGPDPSRSHHYPTKSSPYLDGSDPYLNRSSQTLALVIKPEIDPNQLETDKTWTEKYDQISRSVSGQIFMHLSFRVKSELGTNPTQFDTWIALI